MTGIVLWIGGVAVAAALAVGIMRLGTAAVHDAQAGAAADAAALAAAAAGNDAAARAADRNDALLISIEHRGSVVRVVVGVGGATAEAFAERILVPIRSPG
jgi:hypothetical protein